MRFTEALDTPGGHMIACFVAILLGVGMMKIGVAEGKELISVASGALFMAMRGIAKNGGNSTAKPSA